MNLTCRLLCKPSRLRFAATFRLFSYGLAQWRLQGSFVTCLDKVPNADPKASGQHPEGLEGGISLTSLKLRKKSRRNDVAGCLDLRDPLDPPSPPYIGTNKFPKSAEVHEVSRTQVVLLMEPNKRMILFDP